MNHVVDAHSEVREHETEDCEDRHNQKLLSVHWVIRGQPAVVVTIIISTLASASAFYIAAI